MSKSCTVVNVTICFPGHLIFEKDLHLSVNLSFLNSLFPLSFVFPSLPCPLLSGLCGVIEQKDEGGQQADSACGAQTQTGHAGLCEYDFFFSIISMFKHCIQKDEPHII